MQRLEVSGAVRPLYGSLGVEGLIFSDCNQTRALSTDLCKSDQMSDFMIICPVGVELFHVSDGQTDVIKLTAAFRGFEKGPEK